MDSSFHPITLHLPKRIEIGAGSAMRAGDLAAAGTKVLVIASRSTGGLAGKLGLNGLVVVHDQVPAEPKDKDLDAAIDAAKSLCPDLIVGLGGGSVMDIAKLVSVLWGSDQQLATMAGVGQVTRKYSLLAQVPTTAGTGSEGGIRALFTRSDTGMKQAVESPLMIADLAILDPLLTMSLPPFMTAATGLDALAHCVEAYTSLKAHPLIDDYARMGMSLVGRYLQRAVENGLDVEARAGMLLASFYGGLCLGPVNTAAGHALAYPLSTRAGLGHGLANALVFPHVLAFNAPACPSRTAAILQALRLEAVIDPGAVQEKAGAFCAKLGIDVALSAHGVGEHLLASMAKEAHEIRRLMDNNPRAMSVEDIEAIYRGAL